MYKIGNVCLDETYYPGEDLYSDGAVEERLLELAEEYGISQEEVGKDVRDFCQQLERQGIKAHKW